MHCLIDESEPPPPPASGPKFIAAIQQALDQLSLLVLHDDYDVRGWPDHAKLWLQLLTQSKNEATKPIAPNILKGDLASPLGFELSGRKWTAFEKWFSRNVKNELLRLSAETGIPAIRAIRISKPYGGYPGDSESIYFLVFDGETDFSRGTFQPSSREKANQGRKGELGNFIDQSLKRLVMLYRNSRIWLQGKQDPIKSHITKIENINNERKWRFGTYLMLVGIFILLLFKFFIYPDHEIILLATSLFFFILGMIYTHTYWKN